MLKTQLLTSLQIQCNLVKAIALSAYQIDNSANFTKYIRNVADFEMFIDLTGVI